MKLLIAFAAVLSSAALTVPTLTEVSGSDAAVSRQVASLPANSDGKNG